VQGTEGSNKFQLVTDDLIYYYQFDLDDDTFIPALKNVMFNYMQCSSIVMDKNSKLSISYKNSQEDITIYQRKYDHGFHEIIDSTSREGCNGRNVDSKGIFLISDDNYF